MYKNLQQVIVFSAGPSPAAGHTFAAYPTLAEGPQCPPPLLETYGTLGPGLSFFYIFLGLFGQSHEPVCDARGAIANTKQKDFHFVYTNILACFPG